MMRHSTHAGRLRSMEPVAAAHNLAAAGWGAFLIWMGIVFLAGVGAAVTQLGIGVIVVVIQALRYATGLPFEGVWIAVGALFLIGGGWALIGGTLPLLPALLIVGGAALLLSIVRR